MYLNLFFIIHMYVCVCVWKGEEDKEPRENLGDKQFFALVNSPHNYLVNIFSI